LILKKKRIVITGGPCTGKTSIINFLKKEGYYCFNEISREIIKNYQKAGITQPFLSKPKEFSEQLLTGRIQQYENGSKINQPYLFYDRSIIDILGYMDYAREKTPPSFTKSANTLIYDTVFILPPWKTIFTKDNERLESYEEALKINNSLAITYTKYGYAPIIVPPETIENRAAFILNSIT